jgi:hypothetical protein
MPNVPTFPVRDLPWSFAQAAVQLDEWNRGPAPRVSYGSEMYSIGLLADLVAAIGAELGFVPDHIYELVCITATEFGGGPEGHYGLCQGPKDQTYPRVADCLGRLYRAKVAYYRSKAIYLRPEPRW